MSASETAGAGLNGVASNARAHASHPEYAPTRPPALLLLPLLCLCAAALFGFIISLYAAFPLWYPDVWPISPLIPLHVFLAVASVLTGTLFLLISILRRVDPTLPARFGAILLTGALLFVLAGAVTILAGRAGGREYVPWPILLAPLPILLFGAAAWAFLRRFGAFARLAPEGTWLITIGLMLLTFGLVERAAGMIGGLDYARDLSVEWHALDAIFAGWNATLYGLGVLVIARPGRSPSPRSTWLFVIATFALLSTFGHHHYMSPQPNAIKFIALAASLLAGISFIRHARAAIGRRAEPTPAGPFFLAAELWTLYAIGTGILMAIPQINRVLHGTYAVVGHSMGSMLGVNTMLFFGCVLHLHAHPRTAPQRFRLPVRLVNLCIVAICLDLIIAGVVKGILRFDNTYAVYQLTAARCLIPLPLLGIALFVSLTWLGWRTWWSVRPLQSAPQAPAETADPHAARAPHRHPPGRPARQANRERRPHTADLPA